MKIYIKEEEGYIVDLVTYNPNLTEYIEHEVKSYPADVCNSCYKFRNGVFELDTAKLEKRKYSILSPVEKLIQMTINSISLSNGQALEVKELFPVWKVGETYPAGYKIQYDERLFKVRQEITALEHQPPGSLGMGAIYEEINEINAGTLDDPIPYDPVAGMELKKGIYYSQNNVTYLCIRSSGQPLYHDLYALIGNHVQIV